MSYLGTLDGAAGTVIGLLAMTIRFLATAIAASITTITVLAFAFRACSRAW